MKPKNLKKEIIELLKNNIPYSVISKQLGCAKSTISYYAKQNGFQKQIFNNLNWSEIQNDINNGLNQTNLRKKYKTTRATLLKAVKENKISDPRKKKRTLDILLSTKHKSRGILKKELFKQNLLKNECYECKLQPLWNNKPLIMHLDHINGINNDNRLENLRVLCPNCHSQTETYAGKNSYK